MIAKSGQSLLAIINDILDLSKIEAGKLEVETLDVDPAETSEIGLRLFAERARSKGLDLAGRITVPPGTIVRADPVRLGQVLSNLINNALKFTETGSVVLHVSLEGERVRFAVEDTGIGIDPSKLATIFDAFSQADQSTTRRFGGTGLGLAIGKKLVTAMGGELEASSEPGKGSSFHFSLPRSPASEVKPPPRLAQPGAVALVELADPATAASARLYLSELGFAISEAAVPLRRPALAIVSAESLKASGRPALAADGIVAAVAELAAPADDLVDAGLADFALQYPLSRVEIFEIGEWLAAGRPARTANAAAKVEALPNYASASVLVVDDSAVNLEVAQGALARFGVVPTTAVNGREAVEAHAKRDWELILMDGSMPEMDGFDAARAIRAAENHAHRKRTPIVALTAHVVGAAAEEWRKADMDGALHKPYTLTRLGEVLAAHLGVGATAAPQAKTPAAGPKAPPKLLNTAALDGLAEMSGDVALVARVARLYCATAPARIAELREALERNDLKGQAAAAHALKSMSLNIGAEAIAATAARLERQAREAEKPAAPGDVDRLAAQAEETFALLRAKVA